MQLKPHDLVSPQRLSELLGVSERTLRRWRQKGTGPEFLKLSGLTIVYCWCDVCDWLNKHRQFYND